MRITPLEIRQKSFEKKIRGYDKDEVNAFLGTMSSEWERMIDENKELKIKLEQAEKEVRKLREVESSLFKTLKTAEDTGANLIDQANKAAELHLKETEMNAEALMSESKTKAKAIIEEAEQQAKELILEMQEAIKALEKDYRTIESQRDTLVTELKNMTQDIQDRIQRKQVPGTEFKVEDHMIRVRNLARESESKINEKELETKASKSDPIPKSDGEDSSSREKLQSYIQQKSKTVKAKLEEEHEDESKAGEEASFFDQIDT